MLEVYQALAQRIGCPEALLSELELVVLPQDAPYVLYCAGDEWVEPGRLAQAFHADPSRAAEVLEDLFRKGFLARRQRSGSGKAGHPAEGDGTGRRAEPSGPPEYHANEFYALLLRQLGEGRLGHVGQASLDKLREYCFAKRLDVTDRLLEQGQLTASSEVFPVEQAFSGHRHPHPGVTTVMAGVDARRLVAETAAIQLLPCTCRMTYQRCSKPLETCLILGTYAEEYRARGVGRAVTPSEAGRILEVADGEGLVHLVVNKPGDRPFALCSCCSCCCHDLRALFKYGRTSWVRKAPWIARTDPDRCTACGTCTGRCVFGARNIKDGALVLQEDKCYGCGLCVTTCPQEAITLAARASAPGQGVASAEAP